jgi:hypothetical protein
VEITLYMAPPKDKDEPMEVKRVIEIPMFDISQNPRKTPSGGGTGTRTSGGATGTRTGGGTGGGTRTGGTGGGAPRMPIAPGPK